MGLEGKNVHIITVMPSSGLRALDTTELVAVGRDGTDLVESDARGGSDAARGDGAEGGGGESDGGHFVVVCFMCIW